VSAIAVTVNILDRDYQISCSPEEEALLRSAATYLDEKMREVRDRGNVIGIDRIAVMAALNIAHEFLQLKPLEDERRSIATHIASLRDTVSKAIAAQDVLSDIA
jgi:cell division protein ZapA